MTVPLAEHFGERRSDYPPSGVPTRMAYYYVPEGTIDAPSACKFLLPKIERWEHRWPYDRDLTFPKRQRNSSIERGEVKNGFAVTLPHYQAIRREAESRQLTSAELLSQELATLLRSRSRAA